MLLGKAALPPRRLGRTPAQARNAGLCTALPIVNQHRTRRRLAVRCRLCGTYLRKWLVVVCIGVVLLSWLLLCSFLMA
jgi:hypothetical protein